MDSFAETTPVGAHAAPFGAATPAGPPLVVDLDGTLVRSDLLVESFLALLSARPLQALRALGALRRGKAAFKAALADQAQVDVHTLPYAPAVLAQLEAWLHGWRFASYRAAYDANRPR